MRSTLLLRVIESEMSTDSVLETGLQTGFGNDWLRVGGLKMSIDGGIIGATLKHGVLTLDLPAADEARPRQIQVNVG